MVFFIRPSPTDTQSNYSHLLATPELPNSSLEGAEGCPAGRCSFSPPSLALFASPPAFRRCRGRGLLSSAA